MSVSQGSSSLPDIQVFAISYIEDKFIPDNDDILDKEVVDPLISKHHGTGGCSDMQNVWRCKIEIFIIIEWISYIQDTSLHDNVNFLRFKSHLSEFWTSFFSLLGLSRLSRSLVRWL